MISFDNTRKITKCYLTKTEVKAVTKSLYKISKERSERRRELYERYVHKSLG